jgi:hypothetical protein
MEIPDNLFPGVTQHTGPVLVILERGEVKRGFALRKDEFVTSISSLNESRKKAGLPALEADGV